MKAVLLIVAAIILFSAPVVFSAVVPNLVRYQGRLTDPGGNPVADGNYSVTFTLYDAPTGGGAVWTENQSVVTSSGLFAVLLGSLSPLTAAHFASTSRYLAVKVGSDAEQSPRTRLVAVPYADRVSTIDASAGGIVSGQVSVLGDQPASYALTGDNLAGGSNGTNVGARGYARNNATNWGVYGLAYSGGAATNSAGIYGSAISTGGTAWAGYFDGWVNVTGTLYAGAKYFRIDDPTDPANGILQHASVESDEYKNVYDGVVTTDASGRATITLPDWFDVLNEDFRYQLTVIGQFAQAIVAEKMADNRFSILTDKPNVEVSWQVTGVRRDPYAKAHPIEVQKAKPAELRGKYLHPLENGVDEKLGIEYGSRQVATEQSKQAAEKANRDAQPATRED